jgi:hypothetical protein
MRQKHQTCEVDADPSALKYACVAHLLRLPFQIEEIAIASNGGVLRFIMRSPWGNQYRCYIRAQRK